MLKNAAHPGTVLKSELLGRGIVPTEFARQIDVPPNRVSQIIAGKRSITGDTALRFAHWFSCDPEFWMNLQTRYDLAIADQEMGEAIKKLPTYAGMASRLPPEQPRLA
jgi:addiction module HigA family antidote